MTQPHAPVPSNGRVDDGPASVDAPGVVTPRSPIPDQSTGWDGASAPYPDPARARQTGNPPTEREAPVQDNQPGNPDADPSSGVVGGPAPGSGDGIEPGDDTGAERRQAGHDQSDDGSGDDPAEGTRAGDGVSGGRAPDDDPLDNGGDDDLTDDGEEEEAPEPAELLARIVGLLGGDASGAVSSIGTGDVRVRGQNATGFGATAIGTLNHIRVVGLEPDGAESAWCEAFPATQVTELAASYAWAPSDDEFDLRLHRQHLVCLGGRPGTGRYTAACLALARRHGVDRVGVLFAPRLADLIRPDGPLRRGVGHLVRLDPERHEVDGLTIVGLAARVAALDASLVIVGDFDRHNGELADELLEHRPPPSRGVFRAQLRHRMSGRCLGDCPSCVRVCVDEYIDREVEGNALIAAYLAGAQRPAELVVVVEKIARTAPRGAALNELLGRVLPEQLRERARTILSPSYDDVRVAGTGDADSLRAFRLSCAVFDGQPVADVWRAARRLHPPASTGDPAASAGLRQPEFGLLLGGPLRQAVSLTDDRSGLPEAGTIRFSAANHQLRTHLLDLAWSEWGASDRLLRWLAELIQTETPAIRQAAAGTIGRSARSGIGPVLAVVNELSRDPRPGIRQAAGIALVSMAVQPALRRRIRAEMEKWAAGSTRQRDTVARAYALGLGQIWPDVAVQQLRLVAEARMQRWNDSVVRGLVAVYRGGNPALVLTTLVSWTRTPDREVRLHAARTLRVLAERWAAPPRSHWPELLDLVRAGTLPIADVAAVWAVALSLPGTAYRCWRTLGFWLNRADKHPELSNLCIELLRHTITGQPLRRRLEHQVSRIWRPIMPNNQLLYRVSRLTIAS